METLVTASIIFLLVLIITTKLLRPSLPNLPPGPPELPLIGSMHRLIGTLPHHALRALSQTYGPIMHLNLGEVPTVIISSRDIAKHLLKTHDASISSRPSTLASRIMLAGGTDVVLAPYGAYWRQMRRICVQELLSAKRVMSFHSIREDESSNLVDMIRTTSSNVNLSRMIYSFATEVIAMAAFGTKCREVETYLLAMRKALDQASGFKVVDMFPSTGWVGWVTGSRVRLEKCHRDVDRIIEGIIKERKERRAAAEGGGGAAAEENILDVLLSLQDKGGLEFPLTLADIKAVVFDMFAGGSGSSASTTVWAMSELMRSPSAMKKAQSELRAALSGKDHVKEKDIMGLTYLKLVVKETLRLHPPAPLLIPRECTAAVEADGYAIPAGTRVVFNAWAMGRDPKVWGDDAEEFIPERFEGSMVDFRGGSYEFLPFGSGRRVCPGMGFGVANVELALAAMMYHFEWSLPDGVGEVDMSESVGLGVRKKFDLCLHATPYAFGRK